MTPMAVPYSTVASAPVLQMVTMRGRGGSSSAPNAAMRRQASAFSRAKR
jgi:hypothetical protein